MVDTASEQWRDAFVLAHLVVLAVLLIVLAVLIVILIMIMTMTVILVLVLVLRVGTGKTNGEESLRRLVVNETAQKEGIIFLAMECVEDRVLVESGPNQHLEGQRRDEIAARVEEIESSPSIDRGE